MRLAPRRLALVAILHAFLTGPSVARAQEQVRTQPITWSLESHETILSSGIPFSVTLRATIPNGWHLYGLSQPRTGPVATHVLVDSSGVFELAGSLSARPPVVSRDASFDVETATYTDSVSIAVPVIARATGTQLLRLTVEYQSCTDRFCVPPRQVKLQLPLIVGASLVRTDSTFELTPRLPAQAMPNTVLTVPLNSRPLTVNAVPMIATQTVPFWKTAIAVVGGLLLVVTFIYLRGKR